MITIQHAEHSELVEERSMRYPATATGAPFDKLRMLQLLASYSIKMSHYKVQNLKSENPSHGVI